MTPLALAFALSLQAAPPPPARLVAVTVTDERGTPVEGLALEEVAVLENGVARPVTELVHDQRPLTVAVLVDSSAPIAGVYRLHLVEPVVQFLTRLPEGSRFAVWTTGDRPHKVVDFTTDAGEAGRALRRVYPQGGNTLLDAVVEASRELKQDEGGRAVVLVVTGLGLGFANYDRQRVVDDGLRSGATFLAVQFDEGRATLDLRSRELDEVGAFDYEYVLDRLTDRTGGRRESPLTAMGVAASLQKLVGHIRGQYRLRYEPLPGAKDDERKLEVTVARPGAKVQVVPGRP